MKPFPIPLGAISPATASAVFDQDHYSVNLKGEAELARLLNIAKALGVGTPGGGLGRRSLKSTSTWPEPGLDLRLPFRPATCNCTA